LIFAFVGLFTPGPNIILLTISGMQFGVKDTIPHLLGVAMGTGFLAALSSLGVNTIIFKVPLLEYILKIISISWITYLALQLLVKDYIENGESRSRPFKFSEAVLFQFINPKLWALTLSASAGFSLDGSIFFKTSYYFILFSLVNFMVCFFWLVFGSYVSKYLKKKIIWRCFMFLMAIFLLFSGYLILIQ
jgi:threonine/homoserine/homoserine lactone efflux protein